jgi:hypothetical protein
MFGCGSAALRNPKRRIKLQFVEANPVFPASHSFAMPLTK